MDHLTVELATPSGDRPSAQGRAWLARPAALFALVLAGIAGASGAAGSLDGIVRQVDAGEFAAAQAAIDSALADPGLAADEKRRIAFERERMRRIRLDFSLSRDDAIAKLRERIPDLTGEQFEAWDAAGLLEHMDIDGERRWFNRAPSNLFRLSAEARARSSPPFLPNDGPMETANAHHRELRDAALANGGVGVATRRVRVTHTLTVDADAAPAGETLRAWLPFPRSIPGQQESIELAGSTPTTRVVAPESQMQRSVYLEQPAAAGEPTAFQIVYELTVHGRYRALDAANVVPARITPELAP